MIAVLVFGTIVDSKSFIHYTFQNQKYKSAIDSVISNAIVQKYWNKDLEIQTVYEAIIDLEFDSPHIILTQIIIESGNLTSNLCKKYNNSQGNKVAKRRYCWANKKIHQNNAQYAHWIYSILDFKEYQLSLREQDYSKAILKIFYGQVAGYGKRVLHASRSIYDDYNIDTNYVSDINEYVWYDLRNRIAPIYEYTPIASSTYVYIETLYEK